MNDKTKERRTWKRGQGTVRKRYNVWWIRYSIGGKRIEERTDARARTEAQRMLNERLGQVAKGETPAAVSKVRLAELYADIEADYRNKGQDLRTLTRRWNHLEPVFGTDPVRTITHARMQNYVEVRQAEGAAKATIKNEVAALRRMLRLGYRNRKVAQLPPFPEIEVDNARAVFFDDAEYDRLLNVLPDLLAEGRDVGNEWILPFLTVARWTGARRDELLNLERRQLDLDAGKITLDPGSTKNGEGRAFYLPAEALGALKAWDEQTRDLEREHGIIVRNVFHRHGEPIRRFPYELWHAAVTKAGIAGRRIVHDFRRTAARSYRRSGVSEGVVMKILGHKTRSMFERYNIKNEDDLREAAVAVGNELGRNGTGRAKVTILPAAAKEKSQ
jgi:integrase